MVNNNTFDWIIAGGGVVGLALALRIKQRDPSASILVLEKEAAAGVHASGRNSGVLHAGLYYAPDTLKAKLCVKGKAAMRSFCLERGLPVQDVGKVLIAQTSAEDKTIDTLMTNGSANGTPLRLIDDQELNELEPAAAKTGFRTIYSPSTAVVDPKRVLKAMAEELTRDARPGTEIGYGEAFLWAEPEKKTVTTSFRNLNYGHFINACGAYADRVAHSFGVGRDFFLLPFRGAYKQLRTDCPITVNGNIYPVPDLNMPFLGVHFTRGISGEVSIGPTAFPALGSEHYGGLSGIDWIKLPGALATLTRKYVRNQHGFRNLTHRELRTLSNRGFYEQARRLVPTLKPEHVLPSTKVGIRPQLVRHDNLELIMDFKVVQGENSTHVLNAISPAFTCSFSFADHLIETYLGGA